MVLEVIGLFIIYLTIVSLFYEPGFFKKLGLNDIEPTTLFAGLAFAFIAKTIAVMLLQYIQHKVLYQLTFSIADRGFVAHLEASLSEHVDQDSSDALNQISMLGNMLPTVVIFPALTFLSELMFVCFALIALLLVKTKVVLLITAILIPVAGLILYAGKRILKRHGDVVTERQGAQYKVLQEVSTGYVNVVLNDLQTHFRKRFNVVNKEILQSRVVTTFLGNLAPIRMVEMVAVVAICIMAYYYTGKDSTTTIPSTLALFAGFAFRLLPSLNRIATSYNTFTSYSSIIDFIPAPHLVDIKVNKNEEISQFESLEVDGGSFAFEGRDKILRKVSLTVRKGDYVGLIGKSGSGKSTLLNLLMGFYKPSEGRVLVNGLPVEQVKSTWHRRIGYVNQDAFVFNGTVRSNICLGDEPHDNDHYNKVLEASHLTDWINALPEGDQTDVGELGAKLSGGQKQRLALARCLYKNADVLILDEVTSALDEPTQDEIWNTISEINKSGVTIIMVSHDLRAFPSHAQTYQLTSGKLEHQDNLL